MGAGGTVPRMRVPLDPHSPNFAQSFEISFREWQRASADDRDEWTRRRKAAIKAYGRSSVRNAPPPVAMPVVPTQPATYAPPVDANPWAGYAPPPPPPVQVVRQVRISRGFFGWIEEITGLVYALIFLAFGIPLLGLIVWCGISIIF